MSGKAGQNPLGPLHAKNQESSWLRTLSEAYSYIDVFTPSLQRLSLVSIPKVAGLMSYGFLLCLGLSNIAQAIHAASAVDEMNG